MRTSYDELKEKVISYLSTIGKPDNTQDLIDYCGTTRKTFYKYIKSNRDLYESIAHDFTVKTNDALARAESAEDVFEYCMAASTCNLWVNLSELLTSDTHARLLADFFSTELRSHGIYIGNVELFFFNAFGGVK